jgi:hypothetical protein
MKFDKELLFRCDCHDRHFVSFSYDKEWGYMVELIQWPDAFKNKIRDIIKIIRGKRCSGGEILLSNDDAKKLEDFFAGKNV